MDIQLHVDKFHEIIFRKYVIRKIKPKDQTIRSLLGYYQGIVCNKYPTEDSFTFFQEKNYDMSYFVRLNTYGCYSVLTYTLKAVDPKYIQDPAYTYSFLEDAFHTCTETLIKENNFDMQIFKKVKKMYYSNLLYSKENERKTAFQNAISYYFKGTIRDFDPNGSIEELRKITPKKLYSYYLKTKEDQAVSYVIGNTTGNFIIEDLHTITPKYKHFFTKRGIHEFHKIEAANTKQTYLQLIYDTKIYPNQKLFYAVSFLNYLFGGSANSRLFQIVREKYGYCYSISSTHLGASGILMVSIILDKKNVANALEATKEAYQEILKDVNIEEIKKMFLLEKKGRTDYISNYSNEDFMDKFFVDSLPSYKEEEIIKNLTISDLKKAYKKMELSFIYEYGGNENEE